MPFEVRKQGDKWAVYNLEKKRYAKMVFDTKQKALNMIKVWLKYSHRK
tara:strand:+ start:468 stop:611 length:144 start_codon:yes stop_codon:yes gene_type:complete